MSSEGGEAPVDRNASVSGANAPAVRDCVGNDVVCCLLKTFLLTYLNSSICIPLKATHNTNSPCSEAPTDRSASSSGEANVSGKVRRI